MLIDMLVLDFTVVPRLDTDVLFPDHEYDTDPFLVAPLLYVTVCEDDPYEKYVLALLVESVTPPAGKSVFCVIEGAEGVPYDDTLTARTFMVIDKDFSPEV